MIDIWTGKQHGIIQFFICQVINGDKPGYTIRWNSTSGEMMIWEQPIAVVRQFNAEWDRIHHVLKLLNSDQCSAYDPVEFCKEFLG